MAVTKTEAKRIADLSDKELMDEWTKAGKAVADAQDQLVAFSEEHQRRTRREQLRAQVGDLSEEDMALLQEVRAEGVESEEQVNG